MDRLTMAVILAALTAAFLSAGLSIGLYQSLYHCRESNNALRAMLADYDIPPGETLHYRFPSGVEIAVMVPGVDKGEK